MVMAATSAFAPACTMRDDTPSVQYGDFSTNFHGQADWLRQDLTATPFPTVVFLHQGLEREDGGEVNQGLIRSILEQPKLNSGEGRVIACFSGHHHRDYVRRIRGIHYAQINSMSYHWLGGAFIHPSYGPGIGKMHPDMKYTASYKDPLYALVTLDPKRGALRIEGIKSEFAGPSPRKWGTSGEKIDDVTLTPYVSDWKMPI